MGGMKERYEKLVDEENQLAYELETCEEAVAGICHWVYKYRICLDESLIKDFINYICERQKDIFYSLMQKRLEKATLANAMDNQNVEQ